MIKKHVKIVKNNIRNFDKKIHKRNFIKYILTLVLCVLLIFIGGGVLEYPFDVGFILIILIIYGLFSHIYKEKLSVDRSNLFKNGDLSENKILKEVKEYARQAVPRNRNLKLNIGAKLSIKEKVKQFRKKLKESSSSDVSTEKYIEVK